MKRLSVIITNFNYAQFLRAAVESALNLDWPDVEVVVVDDGSTDGSAELLKEYEGQIVAVMQQNTGQRVAANTGYSLTTGDAVLFLDSDDVLPRSLGQAVDRWMGPDVSKVQFQAQRISESGVAIGSPFPTYRPLPSPSQVRSWMMRTSAYPTPPGSMNVYSRTFLNKLMPLPDVGDSFTDSALLAAAPLLGDVVSVPGVHVGYRRHGTNDSNLLHDAERFSREVRRARIRWTGALSAASLKEDLRPLRRSRELLQMRVAAHRLTPRSPALDGDDYKRLTVDALRAPIHPGPESLFRRILISCWVLVVLNSPAVVSRHLIVIRYSERRT